MKTLLEAIQKYPEQFISTLEVRANTTPSKTNKLKHLSMAEAISKNKWWYVEESLKDNFYRKPLEGVVFCLDMDYDFTEKNKIVNLFKEGKFV